MNVTLLWITCSVYSAVCTL